MGEYDGAIAKTAGGAVSATLAALLGIAHPAAGAAAAGVSGGVASVMNHHRERRNDRRRRRLELTMESLSARVADIETSEPMSEELADPFWSVVEDAMSDEEDRKIPFYSMILDWILRDKPPPGLIVQLAFAVKAATYVELYAFVDEEMNQGKKFQRALNDLYGGTTALHERLSSLGLTTSPSIRGPGHSHVRPIGKVLLAGVNLDDLPVDLGEVQRGNDAVTSWLRRSGKDI